MTLYNLVWLINTNNLNRKTKTKFSSVVIIYTPLRYSWASFVCLLLKSGLLLVCAAIIIITLSFFNSDVLDGAKWITVQIFYVSAFLCSTSGWHLYSWSFCDVPHVLKLALPKSNFWCSSHAHKFGTLKLILLVSTP